MWCPSQLALVGLTVLSLITFVYMFVYAKIWGKLFLREEMRLVEGCFFGWIFKQILPFTIVWVVIGWLFARFLR